MFSDEDLKRLKETMSKAVYRSETSIKIPRLADLLARLEAAESVLNNLSCGERENLQSGLALWRKSAGMVSL